MEGLAIRLITFFITIGIFFGCSDEQFSSDHKKGSADSSIEVPTASRSDNDVSEPVMIGGAFLNCQAIDEMKCRLDNQDTTNLPIPSNFQVEFIENGNIIPFTELPADSNWRWALDTDVDFDDLVLVLRNGDIVLDFSMEADITPLHLGNNGTDLSHCYINNARDPLYAGPGYIKAIQVKKAGLYRLAVQGICGILDNSQSEFWISRENDGASPANDNAIPMSLGLIQNDNKKLSPAESPVDIFRTIAIDQPMTIKLNFKVGPGEAFIVNSVIWSEVK